MIIHGKNVELIFEEQREISSFSDLFFSASRVMTRLIREKGKEIDDPDVRGMAISYLNKDIDNLFRYGKSALARDFTRFLNTHPEFMTSANFTIKVLIYLKKETDLVRKKRGKTTYSDLHIADYQQNKSSLSMAYFSCNLEFILYMALLKGPEEIFITISHEFVHHLQWETSVKLTESMERVLLLSQRKGIPLTLLIIMHCFDKLRREGVARFFESYKKNRTIKFSHKNFTKFIDLLEDFSKISNNKVLLENFKKFSNSELPYHLGSMLFCVIIINELRKRNKQDWMSIQITDFIFFGKRNHSIDAITRFYGNKNFEVTFVADSEVDETIIGLIVTFTRLHNIAFLRGYEAACEQLGINPVINIQLYNHYKSKCLTKI